MYIGSTDTRGLHHLVWEIIDNGIDEALAGFGKELEIVIKKDNSIIIKDQGRGMPYKMHELGVPTTEIIFTKLHSGGKFSSDGGYKVSGGLHGVGSAVVNALSQFLEVTVYRDGGIWQQRYENGGKNIRSEERRVGKGVDLGGRRIIKKKKKKKTLAGRHHHAHEALATHYSDPNDDHDVLKQVVHIIHVACIGHPASCLVNQRPRSTTELA